MNVYELQLNGQQILTVDVGVLPWLPVRPRVRPGWLRYLVTSALRRYFREAAAVVTA